MECRIRLLIIIDVVWNDRSPSHESQIINVRATFITYEEQHNKWFIYRTNSHVCHNKIDVPPMS